MRAEPFTAASCSAWEAGHTGALQCLPSNDYLRFEIHEVKRERPIGAAHMRAMISTLSTGSGEHRSLAFLKPFTLKQGTKPCR